MEESIIPSISTGTVGSRFVSQNDIESAKARRDEQWKAAYARYADVDFSASVRLLTSLADWAKNPHHSLLRIPSMAEV